MTPLSIERAPGVSREAHAAICRLAFEAVAAAALDARPAEIDVLCSLDRRTVRSARLLRPPGSRRPPAEVILAPAAGRRLSGVGQPASGAELVAARHALREQRGEATMGDVLAAEARAVRLLRADFGAVASVVSTLEHQLLTNRLPRVRIRSRVFAAIMDAYAGAGARKRERACVAEP